MPAYCAQCTVYTSSSAHLKCAVKRNDSPAKRCDSLTGSCSYIEGWTFWPAQRSNKDDGRQWVMDILWWPAKLLVPVCSTAPITFSIHMLILKAMEWKCLACKTGHGYIWVLKYPQNINLCSHLSLRKRTSNKSSLDEARPPDSFWSVVRQIAFEV